MKTAFFYEGDICMTERDKMLKGELYNPLDDELVQMRLNARLITESFNLTSVRETEKRVRLIKQLFGATGDSVLVEPSFQCDYGCNIYVGNKFYMNFNCVILDVAEVIIGDNCMIAPMVGIYTATHPVDPDQRNCGLEYAKPVTIGHNCWIGANAVINPGVTLGDNVVVASGAVVTKRFGNNVVIGGNPARIIAVC
jgi:maltose O-acetyltransferase